jgi:electron transport complex protein RnfG
VLKEIVKYGSILMIVTLSASGALALVNRITAPKIEAQQQQELARGLSYVLPGTGSGIILPESLDNMLIYKGYADRDTTHLIGYAFSAFGKGYSSVIWTLVGIDTAGMILKINILDQKETPGLGTRSTEIKSGESEPWWQSQFQGKESRSLQLGLPPDRIQAITGATITSKAITESIRLQSGEVLKRIQMNEG